MTTPVQGPQSGHGGSAEERNQDEDSGESLADHIGSEGGSETSCIASDISPNDIERCSSISSLTDNVDCFSILQSNISSMSNRMLKYFLSESMHDIICIQEHRLSSKRYDTVVRKLKKHFQVKTTMAPIKHVAPQGGVMILIRKCIAVHA